jgi:hypothetical protein
MLTTLTRYLSEPRFATYLNATNGDADRAVELYRKNMTLSSAALESIHTCEIVLRNSIDRELRTWNESKTGSGNWTITPAPLLRGILDVDETLTKAASKARRALRKRREPLHDDIVSQISFGTWKYLLPSQRHTGKQMLWDEALHGAFPLRFDVQASAILESVNIVNDFRNRVAHFEPIFELDLRGKRHSIRNVLNVINRDMRKWHDSRDRFLPEIDSYHAEWGSRSDIV